MAVSSESYPKDTYSDEFTDDNSVDLSFAGLEVLPDFVTSNPMIWKSFQISHNSFIEFPREIITFLNLVNIDISNNGLTSVGYEILYLKRLETFIAKNNLLNSKSVTKDFGLLTSLQTVNFSGNAFTDFPLQLLELTNLRHCYIGANEITSIPAAVQNLTRLEVLYLGGNKLREVPAELGLLHCLRSLVLCDNMLTSLPPTFIHLRNLRSLMLHNNQISTLPTEIVSLNLLELSLRNNPLVVRFVEDLSYDPPSLLELAGRIIKLEKVRYSDEDLPAELVAYLSSAQRCVNPNCKGVYFNSKVENVKFVDFCGKYRLPLLQYLCSPKCTYAHTYSDSETDDEDSAKYKMKKVLLG